MAPNAILERISDRFITCGKLEPPILPSKVVKSVILCEQVVKITSIINNARLSRRISINHRR